MVQDESGGTAGRPMRRLISGLRKPTTARCDGLTQFGGFQALSLAQPKFCQGGARAQPLQCLRRPRSRGWDHNGARPEAYADLGSANDPKGVQTWRPGSARALSWTLEGGCGA
jgi:hypothetical protein